MTYSTRGPGTSGWKRGRFARAARRWRPQTLFEVSRLGAQLVALVQDGLQLTAEQANALQIAAKHPAAHVRRALEHVVRKVAASQSKRCVGFGL
eukprot:3299434-Prymnesium_polylepis.1